MGRSANPASFDCSELTKWAAARAGVTIPDGAAHQYVWLKEQGATMTVQQALQTPGALLFHSCIPVTEFGQAWPAGVPVQVHGMDADPIFAGEGDLDAARDLVGSTENAELFLYPGAQHLFADSSLPSYRPAAAELLTSRVLEFLVR